MMKTHPIVSRAEWLEQRKRLLEEEKKFTHLRESLAEKRRALPWTKVETPYVFDGPNGKETLADLFQGRSQLVVHHLMFAPEWDVPCKSCSFWADSFNGIDAHLNQRDVTFTAISRAPAAKLQAFGKRMGWDFKWISSGESTFNYDYVVSFSPAELATGTIRYNYGVHKAYTTEMPGISVFARDGGSIFHTYSCYARGIDILNTTYNILDLVPKGRDEATTGPMGWLKHRDQYAAL